MPKNSLNVSLKGADDIFSTEESRQEQQREQVQQIPIGELFPFKNHPFKVLDDESMQRTVESVEQYGVLSPLIARPRPEGGYEIISGHRRQHAAQLAGLDMELNFIKCGDYYIPDIKLKNPNIRLGKWGRMRKEYLRLANPVLFSDMVLNETLYEHCAEIEETAKKRMEIIVPQLAKAYGVTEQLKAENQIEWVRQMNACVAQAEEAIKGELIYC